METYPVTVSIWRTVYHIPRNYIVNLFDQLCVLKITFSDFEPLTDKTRSCLNSPPFDTPAGCAYFEFKLHGGKGPDGLADTHARIFRSLMEDAKLAAPPYSEIISGEKYIFYDIGPPTARLEIIRNISKDMLFTCQIWGDPDKVLCDGTVFLDDGNAVQFVFEKRQIAELPKIEDGLRSKMESFRAPQ